MNADGHRKKAGEIEDSLNEFDNFHVKYSLKKVWGH